MVLLHRVEHRDETVVPVLWLTDPNQPGRPQVFRPLIDYFTLHEKRGLQWKRQAARAVGLFYDFCLSYRFAESDSILNIHTATLKAFVQALQNGTLPRKGVDRTGLYWPPASAIVVTDIVRHLDRIVVFAHENLKNLRDNHPLKSLYGAFNDAPTNQSEMIRFLMAAKHRNSKSFMRHVKDDQVEAKRQQRAAYDGLGVERPVSGSKSVKAMDPTLISRMIEVGFLKNANARSLVDREDVTAKMIFLLLAGAGLRRSEPFHVWFNDIAFPMLGGEERCIPMLRHPSQAETYIAGERRSRLEYLNQLGMSPRTSNQSKALHAGWKDLPLDKDSKQTEVFFIHEALEHQFAAYYHAYSDIRRDLVGARVKRGEGQHPFLFVSMGEDRSRGQSCIGNPYSVPAFNRAWDRALTRVEKAFGEPIPRGKKFGTTPHACRHRYGRILEEAGAPTKAIQRALNHRHPLSQMVYTEPEWGRVNAALEAVRHSKSSPLLSNERIEQDIYDETRGLSRQWRY